MIGCITKGQQKSTELTFETSVIIVIIIIFFRYYIYTKHLL